MKILFINSVLETPTNPAYSRHIVLTKLFSEIGEVITLNTFKKNKHKLDRLISFVLSKHDIKKRLFKIGYDSFDVVVLTTIPYPAMKYIKKICMKKNKILIVDCVEWASPEEKKLGKLSLSYIHNTRINEHLIDKRTKVISISSYLSDYFTRKGISTVIIPNLVDVNTLAYYDKQKHEKLELVFAGYPQKKDSINVAIEGILLLTKHDQSMVHLSIAGIDEKSFFNKYKYLLKDLDNIKNLVTFKGKVSSNEVKKMYYDADFSILIRNGDLRVCKAGFPTKLLDSFKYSTPIIANITSDIGKYLKDGENGFVVNDYSPNSFFETMRKVINMFEFDKLNMNTLSKNAFNTCIKYFNYLNYVNLIKRLINNN